MYWFKKAWGSYLYTYTISRSAALPFPFLIFSLILNCIFIYSFAPWCPACKNLAPVWERYANTAKEVNVNVAKIDVTTSPSLSGRFFVTALPTIYQYV